MEAAAVHLHTAAWVVPVSGPSIAGGAVAVNGDTIIAVGKQEQMLAQYPQATLIAHPDAILTPALVNAHIHLELSHLAALSREPFAGSFTGWISQLLAMRDRLGATGKAVEQAALLTARQQYETGVSLIADIGNTSIGRDLSTSFQGILLHFKEYLGLAECTLEKNLLRLQQEPVEVRCSGHAPYSTHPRLLQQIKARATSLGHIFPVHTAEIAAEGEMLGKGRGEMVEFVRQRGFWDNTFVPDRAGHTGSIHYLDTLGLLDQHTLCVHGVHVSEAEMELITATGAKVCLCPGSNQFLRSGIAPVRQYLDHGILPALGTDSLASNPELSLWREMQILSQQQPDVDPADIFAMATLGGAEALGLWQTAGLPGTGKTG